MIEQLSPEEKDYLLSVLPDFLSESRKAKIEEVLAQRTKHVTLVLENIFQEHNAAALIRTADAFGLQEVHVLESYNPFAPASRISRGSEKWITVRHYSTQQTGVSGALKSIKGMGYQLVATSPGKGSVPIEELDISQPTALIFGSERPGLTHEALEYADQTVYIPMRGFAESYNVSVSAGIALYALMSKIPKSIGYLDEKEKDELRLDWYIKSVRHPEQLVPGLLVKRNS